MIYRNLISKKGQREKVFLINGAVTFGQMTTSQTAVGYVTLDHETIGKFD
jgi:hypothetical protein